MCEKELQRLLSHPNHKHLKKSCKISFECLFERYIKCNSFNLHTEIRPKYKNFQV